MMRTRTLSEDLGKATEHAGCCAPHQRLGTTVKRNLVRSCPPPVTSAAGHEFPGVVVWVLRGITYLVNGGIMLYEPGERQFKDAFHLVGRVSVLVSSELCDKGMKLPTAWPIKRAEAPEHVNLAGAHAELLAGLADGSVKGAFVNLYATTWQAHITRLHGERQRTHLEDNLKSILTRNKRHEDRCAGARRYVSLECPSDLLKVHGMPFFYVRFPSQCSGLSGWRGTSRVLAFLLS